jgi:hypothetical protein|tara:strand:+ start:278 stop:388 length:111 start_codon:yes stop_codon:yes gene_type:complete
VVPVEDEVEVVQEDIEILLEVKLQVDQVQAQKLKFL